MFVLLCVTFGTDDINAGGEDMSRLEAKNDRLNFIVEGLDVMPRRLINPENNTQNKDPKESCWNKFICPFLSDEALDKLLIYVSVWNSQSRPNVCDSYSVEKTTRQLSRPVTVRIEYYEYSEILQQCGYVMDMRHLILSFLIKNPPSKCPVAYCLSKGNRIFVGDYKSTLSMFNMSDGSYICGIDVAFKPNDNPAPVIAFSQQRKFLAIVNNTGYNTYQLKIWNYAANQLSTLQVRKGDQDHAFGSEKDNHKHTEKITQCKFFENDTYILTASALNEIKIWSFSKSSSESKFWGHFVKDLSSPRYVKLFGWIPIKCMTHGNPILYSVDVTDNFQSGESGIISGSSDGTVKLFSRYNNKDYKYCQRFVGHRRKFEINCVFCQTGNFIVSSSLDKTTKIWSVLTTDCVLTLNNDVAVRSLCVASEVHAHMVHMLIITENELSYTQVYSVFMTTDGKWVITGKTNESSHHPLYQLSIKK